MDAALSRRLPPLLRDDEGRERLAALLSMAADTAFAVDGINRLLSRIPDPPSWRIGEALAEALLTDYRSCEFPWPGGRDLKNPSASAAGTDLVGFASLTGDECRFAFGEVKTSSQKQWPPTVVDGRHGMRKQLEDLCTSTVFKDSLVTYLGHHSIQSDWQARYVGAARRYFADETDVSLFGVLVRDVDADARDLAGRATTIGGACPAGTSIELLAIYLPPDSIDALPALVAAALGSAQ
ncbi:MAG: hypothetical protein R2826_01550 [Thermoleophilia bacterium]